MFWGKETPYASSITKKVIFLVCNGLCLTLSGKSLSAGALGKLGRPSEEPGLVVPACILWCLWLGRNQICFNRISTASSNIKAKCLITLFSWINLTPVYNPDSFLDFVNSLVL